MPALTTRDRVILVSGLMVTQTIGWGTTFSQIGILAQPISADLGLARSMVFLGATVMYLSASLAAPLSGRMADRLGGLRLLGPGSVALAAGLVLLSLSSGLASYLAAWVLFGLVLHVGLVTAAYTGLTQVMGAGATRAIGTLSLATGLCSSIFWPVSEFGLQHMDWRALCQVYAGVTLVLCLPVNLMLARRFARAPDASGARGIPLVPPHLEPEAQRSGFALHATIASLGAGIGVGFGIAVIDIFQGLGASRAEAVYAGSLIGIFYVVSRGLATLWSDRISQARLAQLVYATLPLSMLPLLVCAIADAPLPGWLAVAVAAGFGLPAGLVGVLRSTFPLYLFGSAGYGGTLGRQTRMTELASAFAPGGLSWLMGVSMTGAIGALVIAGGLGFAGTLRLGRLLTEPPRKKGLKL